MAVVAPRPSARTSTAAKLNAGVRNSIRKANLISEINFPELSHEALWVSLGFVRARVCVKIPKETTPCGRGRVGFFDSTELVYGAATERSGFWEFFTQTGSVIELACEGQFQTAPASRGSTFSLWNRDHRERSEPEVSHRLLANFPACGEIVQGRFWLRFWRWWRSRLGFHRQGDPLGLRVRADHLHLHNLADLHHFVRILYVAVR
jgi:hypothetical protein